MFNRFLLFLLLAHCLFVAHWVHFGNGAADASIVVVATNVTFQDRIAAFGPRLSEEGLTGTLVTAASIDKNNLKGCERFKEPIVRRDLIILIERGECSFIDKVRNMQAEGFVAVVVGDPVHKTLITMYATASFFFPGDTRDVKIPSVFVGQEDYDRLIQSSESDKGVLIKLTKDDILQPLLDVIIVVILSPTIMMIFIYIVWRIRRRQRRRQDIAPPQVVCNLPIKTYYTSRRQENDPTECCICLEDYQDKDELRIMPCKHEFHVACIDSWLTRQKGFCPICKRDVCAATEETPLLP